MRKERERLKHVAEAAFLRRQIDAARGIEKHGGTDRDSAASRLQQTRYAVEQRRFARARGAKKNSESRRNFEGNVEEETARAVVRALEPHLRAEGFRCYHEAHGIHIRRRTRRFMPYTNESTAKERTSSSRASRFASA